MRTTWDNWERSEFQIGDRVVLTYGEEAATYIPVELPSGSIGTIRGHSRSGSCYAVEFDKPFINYPGKYALMPFCNGIVKSGKGWFVQSNHLLLEAADVKSEDLEDFLS